jgi:hypothetical protein
MSGGKGRSGGKGNKGGGKKRQRRGAEFAEKRRKGGDRVERWERKSVAGVMDGLTPEGVSYRIRDVAGVFGADLPGGDHPICGCGGGGVFSIEF